MLADSSCPLCNEAAETAAHLYTGCWFASEIWFRIGNWCRLQPFYAFHVSDLLMLSETGSKNKDQQQLIRGIIYTSMWCIWNELNAKIFTGKCRRVVEVVENIKSSTFFWVRHRS
ncbi:hypothetical protein HanIR_Chr07g0321421 [Helianthus annuus]|nr:hypothetical protein HanIR_Chr07g0321421 [Helianthus annuus]